MQEYKVESFNLDHTKVVAPYIRVADRKEWQGVTVTKFDIRFTQPNKEFLDPAAIHSLEHLLAEELRHQVDNIIDLSPMGCRTGFYLESPEKVFTVVSTLIILSFCVLFPYRPLLLIPVLG